MKPHLSNSGETPRGRAYSAKARLMAAVLALLLCVIAAPLAAWAKTGTAGITFYETPTPPEESTRPPPPWRPRPSQEHPDLISIDDNDNQTPLHNGVPAPDTGAEKKPPASALLFACALIFLAVLISQKEKIRSFAKRRK